MRRTSPRSKPGSARGSAGRHERRAAPLRRRLACAAILFGYGLLLAGLYVLDWVSLERPLSRDAVFTAGLFAAAGTLAAGLARIAAAIQARRQWSARFAAALVLLAAAPPLVLSLVMGVQTLTRFHDISEIPPHIAALIIVILGGGSLYGLLSTALREMVPLALPAMLVFAWLIAVASPCAGGGRSAKAHGDSESGKGKDRRE